MKQKLICILVANLFAASAPVFAQSDELRVSGSVSAGGIYVDDGDAKDPAKLNEYRDLDSGGLLGFDLKGRSSRYWFDAFGENLGRDDQYIDLRGGTYGIFKYRLYSDALRHNFLENGRTPYTGAGSSAHRATFPQLDPNIWNEVDVGYKRRDDGGFFELQAVSPWYTRIDANQVTWKGSKPGAASQGTSPGNGFVDLFFPVEYKTRNLSVEGGYNTRQMHFALSWMVSKFENSEETVTWTNGYFGNGIDTTYLAPDNRYERLSGNFSYRQLPGNSTLAARFTVDELTSSVPLATSVLGTTTGGMQATGPSVPSYEGEVKNETFTVSFASAPMRQLDTKLYYYYRKRDDNSTHVSFNSTAIPGPEANEPYSYKSNNWGFDAYWRFDRANRLGFGYDYKDTEREGRFDYDETKDKRLFVEYKNSSLDNLGARLKYTYLERDSNFLLANSGTSPTDVNYWNRYVTAFDLANVNQSQWKLTLDYTPAPNFDIGFEGILKKNDYEQNTLGRLKDDRREVYLSASYGEPGGPRFTVFGDAEEVKYDSMHRVVGAGTTAGAYEPSAPPNASNYNWNGKVKEENWALGIAFDWPVSKKLSLKASAIYYKTDGMVDLALQDGVPASVVRPIPIGEFDDSRRTSITFKAVYDLTKALTLTGGYAFEKYEYNDQQYDGYRYTIPAATNQNSYLSGVYAFPQSKANIFYGLLTYRF
jgi:MtrB/PioB family decaheme-associated outer membrane protein